MSRKLFFLGILSLVLAPGAALSLGLGEIRLDSYLNQPIDAEIALNLSSPDELDTLRVELAPPEAFERVGLDRPAYLDDLRFTVRAAGPSGALVKVSSSRPITEPFVTFLIEARWNGGRALREYTVLLDPPVFLPAPPVETSPAPATAPAPAPMVDTPQAAPAPVTRPAPQPAPVAAPTPARSDYGSEFGPVQRNDTLWRIAQQVRPDDSLTTNQVMVALYRENPRAFDGNINRLRAGAILRVPSREQMAATPTRDANAEVRRQTDEWRGAAPPPVERRLELAPPAETASAPAPASDTARRPAAPDAELLDAVEALRTDLAETRRLMEVKDAEIAALQARLAELESGDASVPPAGATAPAPAPAEALPQAAEPAPAVEPAPEVKAESPAPAAPAPAPPPPAPTLMDRLSALLGSLWLWVVLALVLVAAAVGIFLRRRKEDDNSIEKDLAATGTWGALDDSDGSLAEATGSAPASRKTVAVAGGAAAAGDLESILEAGPAQREAPPPRGGAAAAPVAAPREPRGEDEYEYPFEDTIAGETGIYLDQTDAMTEADFHMAYGLYDQAAEIVRKAIEREPDQYDLRRKLLEICFVWGNAEEFITQARAIRELDDERVEAEWAKIAIMGRQICPGEAIFEAAPAGEVDMDLGTDEAGVSEDDWLDFDIGEAGSDEAGEEAPLPGDTREVPTITPEAASTEHTAEISLEDLDMDLELGISGEHALRDLAERAPEFSDEAVEDEAEAAPPPAAYVPAEDEEEEDHGGTMVLDTSAMRRASEEPTQRGEAWEMAEDEPTVAGLGGFEEDEDDAEADQTIIKKMQPSYEAPTTQVGGFEEEDDADLSLDDLTQALKADIDLGADEADGPEIERAAEHSLGDTAEMMPAEPFPDEIIEVGDTAEMPPGDAAGEFNEVGTKLDLARAYIDMGDPEGARSILGEVVEEGNEAQRDEARELLASLD